MLVIVKLARSLGTQFRAVPDGTIWESLKAKHYIFVRVVEVGCFSIQWVFIFCENVIL